MGRDRLHPTGGPRSPVAETVYNGRRLIVRRTRLTGVAQARLWPDWRHFGFLTDLTDPDPVALDRFHRAHATVELAIRDLKEGAGLEHVPSGNFSANSAWLCCAVLAHNLVRLTAPASPQRRDGPDRCPHRQSPPPRHARPSRQPLRYTHAASPGPPALGQRVQRTPHRHLRFARPHRLTPRPAARRPARTPPRRRQPTEHRYQRNPPAAPPGPPTRQPRHQTNPDIPNSQPQAPVQSVGASRLSRWQPN